MKEDGLKMNGPKLIQLINFPQLQIVTDSTATNINNLNSKNNNTFMVSSSDTRKAIFKRKWPPQLRDTIFSNFQFKFLALGNQTTTQEIHFFLSVERD